MVMLLPARTVEPVDVVLSFVSRLCCFDPPTVTEILTLAASCRFLTLSAAFLIASPPAATPSAFMRESFTLPTALPIWPSVSAALRRGLDTATVRPDCLTSRS